MAVKLKITLRHSAIGYSQRHKDTVRTLGFKKLHQSVVREDSVRFAVCSTRLTTSSR